MKSSINFDDLLTVEETAEKYGLRVSEVLERLADGRLKGRRISGVDAIYVEIVRVPKKKQKREAQRQLQLRQVQPLDVSKDFSFEEAAQLLCVSRERIDLLVEFGSLLVQDGKITRQSLFNHRQRLR